MCLLAVVIYFFVTRRYKARKKNRTLLPRERPTKLSTDELMGVLECLSRVDLTTCRIASGRLSALIDARTLGNLKHYAGEVELIS